MQSAQRETHSTVQIAQTENFLEKSLDSRIQPCYDATIPGGTVECKPPNLNLENRTYSHRAGEKLPGKVERTTATASG
ncbi:hypothetical protein [Pseudoflavonifractor sp. 524-17]|uniref:hypothetical protein n=1 Tax=Pseudoflavonifractor sp. 524-17 TaxID=2304577 RepID=UPI00137B7909|nr:hypothetical protein [Pseudoflavonifractor sp. 524-17]